MYCISSITLVFFLLIKVNRLQKRKRENNDSVQSCVLLFASLFFYLSCTAFCAHHFFGGREDEETVQLHQISIFEEGKSTNNFYMHTIFPQPSV